MVKFRAWFGVPSFLEPPYIAWKLHLYCVCVGVCFVTARKLVNKSVWLETPVCLFVGETLFWDALVFGNVIYSYLSILSYCSGWCLMKHPAISGLHIVHPKWFERWGIRPKDGNMMLCQPVKCSPCTSWYFHGRCTILQHSLIYWLSSSKLAGCLLIFIILIIIWPG